MNKLFYLKKIYIIINTHEIILENKMKQNEIITKIFMKFLVSILKVELLRGMCAHGARWRFRKYFLY